MTFPIAMHLCGWPAELKEQPEEVLKIARDAGYDGVEGFRVADGNELLELGGLAARYGIRLVNVGAADPGTKAKVNATLGNAAAEIPAARKSGGRDPDDAELDALVDGLRDPVRLFAEYGLKPFHHIHIHTILETPEDCERVLRRLPDLWLLFDTGHLLAANSKPEEVLKRWPGQIAHVHLKDFWTQNPGAGWNRRQPDFWKTNRFCDLGEGNTGFDAKGLLAGLEAVGYNGWISVEEDHPRRDIVAVVRDNRKFLRDLGY